jgi:hypothetical protein
LKFGISLPPCFPEHPFSEKRKGLLAKVFRVWDWTDKNGMHLEAARGWLELGDPRTALDELANISGLRRAQPDVLKVRLQIALACGDWPAAYALSQGLIKARQREAEVFLGRSRAVCHLPDAGAAKALALLLEVANEFPEDPAIPFNLGCYNSLLGQESTEKGWLALAFDAAQRQGTLKKWKAAALTHRDLAPLRKKMGASTSLWL